MKLTGPWFRSLTIAAVMTGLAVISTCSINKVGLGAKVDITPPKLAITSPSTDGQYLSGAVTFSGTASDDIGVTALTLNYTKASGGTAVLPLTLKDGGWTITVPSNTPEGLAEGKQTIEVSGTDSSGKTVTDSLLIYVDNTAPTVMITYPLSYGTASAPTATPQTTSTIDVKGEVADASPITSVVVTLKNSSGGVISTTDAVHNPNPKTANGTNTWSTRFYLKDVVASGAVAIGKLNVTDGTVYNYTVTATDAAGNINSWYFHGNDIAYLVSAGTPTPSVEEISTIDHAATGAISTPSSVTSDALMAKRLGTGSAPVWGNFKYVETSAPTIQFSNIDATGGIGQNLLSPGSVITGNISPQQGFQQIDPASFVATIYESTLPTPVASFTASSVPSATLTTLGDSVAFIIPLKNTAGVSLPPDQYHMTISAQSQGSDTATTTVAFFIDSGAPSLNVNTVPSFIKAPFTFSGTATTTVGLKEIDIYETVNGVPSASPIVVPLSGTTQSWTSPSFPVTPADGGYDYELRLIASTGSTSSIYKSITYDATPPVVTFNSVIPVIGAGNVNGMVTFSSSAIDSNGLSAVKWGVLPAGTACPAWSDSSWKTFAAAPYTQTFDSSSTDMYGTAIVDNSDYKIWVIAQDKAANQTSASTIIHVKQSSDSPTVGLTNLDATKTANPTLDPSFPNVLGVGAKVTGTLGDDDALDTSSVQIEVDGGPWTSLTSTGSSVAQSFSFDLSSLTDGLHTLSIRVSDLASAKNGKPAVTTVLPPVYFAIDRSPPSLVVTSPSTGSLLNGAAVTISGTASAANGLSGGVVLSNGATTIVTAPVNAGSWTASLTAAAAGEGLHSWKATATGVFGTTTTVPVTFTVDTVPPAGTISVPSSAFTWYSGTSLGISGTAFDANAVAKVEWSLDGTTWNTATGTNSWNASIPLTTEGTRSLSIRLTDTAGNQTVLTRGFGVDFSPPTLTEDGTAGTGAASQSNVITNKSASYTLSGSLTDSNQLQSLAVTESKNGGAATEVTTTTTPALGASVKSATWATVSLPLGGLASGTYTYVITATDTAGKTTVFNRTVMIDLQPPAVSLSQPTAGSALQGSLYSLRGTVADNVGGSGTSEIYYIVTASSAAEPSGVSGWTGFPASDGTWSASIDLSSLAEGSKKLWVRAQDAAGNITADGSAANVAFFIDQSPPTLTAVTSPAAAAGIETVNYAFQGTVSDTDALAAAHPLTVSIDGAAALDIIPSGSSWTYPVTTEGLHSYVFTATDIVGKTTQVISTITLDKTAPNVSVSTPSANQWFASPSVTIQGVADDGTGSGVQSVRWAVTPAGQPQPANVATWSTAVGTSTWSTSITLASEGKQTLWYAAIDKAGWVSTVKSVDFGYDLAPPALTETTASSRANSTFSLSGTALDSDALASPDFLTLSVDYGVAIPLGSLSAPYVGTYNSGTGGWTITVNPDLVTHAMDGTHVYQLVATDIAGKTTTLNRTVVIDTTPPSAALSTPTSGSWTVVSGLPAAVSVSGTANDGSGTGVSKVYFKAADSGDGTPAAENPVTEVPATWTLAGGTSANWTGSVSLTTEGQKTLWVKAVDAAGNVMTTAAQLTFGVDAAPPTITASGTTALVSSSAAVVLTGTYADSLGAANLSLSLEVDGVLKPSPGFVTGAGTDSTNGVWSLTIPAPADHSNDGTHSYGIVVKDLSLQTAKVIRNITIDTVAPTVSTVSTPASGSWINGATYSLQGTATDTTGSGVASVWYLLDAASGTDHSSDAYNAAGWSQATGTTAWSANLTLSSYGEGQKKLYVKAVDAAGNAATTAFVVAFGIDQAPPSLTESSIAGVGAASAASFTGSVNTAFSLQGSMSDTDQLSALTVTESANGGAAQAVGLASPAAVSGTSQSWTSQSLPLGGAVSGSYLYTITVTDLAGKTTQITRTVTIDKTPPDVLTITSPVAASLLQGTIASISGTSNDTSAGSTGVAAIYYTFTNNLASEPAGVSGWSSFAASDGAWNTTINLTTVGEGSKILWVRAMDKAGNVTPDGSAAQVAFFIDQTPPTLTETGIGTGTLTTEPAVFDFTGTVSDSDALATTAPLTVSQDGGAAVTIVPAGSSWTYHVTSAAGEGQHTYVFTATDIAGRTTQVTRTIILDTVPPTASITSPVASQWLSGTAFTLKGAADDGNGSGVASVYYKVTNGTDPSTEFAAGTFPAALNGWTAASGTISWQSVWSLTSEGNEVLWVGAIDKAGHKSASLTQVSFGVDQAPPTLTESSPASQTKTADFSFSGSVGDSNALSATVPLTVAIDGGTAAALGSANITYPQWTGSLSSGTWALTAATTGHALDGTHTLVFTATDAAGKTTALTRSVVIDTQAPTLVVNSPVAGLMTNTANLTVSGSANDGSGTGVAAVWYLINDGTAPAVPPSVPNGWTQAGGTPTNWSAAGTLTGSDGPKKVWVSAPDNAGNWSTPVTVDLVLDRVAPTLNETIMGASSKANAAFSFGAAATGATDTGSGVKSFTVTDNGGSPVALTPGTAWAYPVAVDTSSAHANDGSHTYVFTLTDNAGNTATLTRTLTIDSTPAAVTVTSPTAAGWVNSAAPTISGTASDGSGTGVAEVWYIVDDAANDHTADAYAAAGWTKTAVTSPWSAALSGLTEGNKKLTVKTLDKAGNFNNASTTTVVSFGVDLTAPTLTMAPLAAYNTGFPLTGTSADPGTNASGISTLQYKIDSGAYAPVTVAANWSVTILPAVITALNEGSHTVTVMATDAAGNQTTQSASFNYDHTAPTVTFSSIQSSGGSVVQDTNPIVSGSLSDASTIASATYSFQQWNAASASWTTLASTVSLGTPTTNNFNWSVNLGAAGANVPDGKYQIEVGGADVAGNAITPSYVEFLIARSNPQVSLTNPTFGTFQKAGFSLVGNTFDYNGVTNLVAKVASGTVDFLSGTTTALAARSIAVTVGSPATFTTAQNHGLSVGQTVYLWGSSMPVTVSGATVASSTAYTVASVSTATTFTLKDSGGNPLNINTSTAADMIAASPSLSFTQIPLTVTVTANSPTIALAGNTLKSGQMVYFGGSSLPAGISGSQAYYVASPTSTDFKVATDAALTNVVTPASAGSSVVVSPSIPWMIPSLSVPGTDGSLTAYVQITAGSGKTAVGSRDFTLDSAAPVIALSSPTSATRSVGNLTLIGTTTDPGSIPSGVTGTIQYQIGKDYNLTDAGSWISTNVTGGAYSWTISLGDMSAFANSTKATQCDTNGVPATGTNLWKLPIVFQAVDKAGNVQQLTSYYLILDPNGNVPVVNISQPATGLTWGGSQRISGTAVQPVWIHDVEVAVDPAGGTNFPANPVSVSLSGNTLSAAAQPFTNGMMVFLSGSTAPQISGANVLPATPYWVINKSANSFQVAAASASATPVSFSSAGAGVTATVWAPATLVTTGNSVIWYYDINTTTAYPQNAATSQQVSVQVRAWNAPTVGGARGTISGTLTTPLSMTFNSTFPTIQGLTVNGRSYVSQMTEHGTQTLTATVSSSRGISKIEGVESSPYSGSTTIYDTSTNYGNTSASYSLNPAYWSSTVTPPAAKTSYTAGSGDAIIITKVGSDSSLWTGAGASAGALNERFVPNKSFSVPDGSFIESDASGNFSYQISMTINSLAMFASTGQYSFNIRATDIGTPSQVTNAAVTINEDNSYPTSTVVYPNLVSAPNLVPGVRYYITDLGSPTVTDFTAAGAGSNQVGQNFVASSNPASGNGHAVPVLTGTNYKVQGSATDVGTVSGLSKIVVYLTDPSGKILDIKTGGGAVTATQITAMDMANGGAVGSISYPNTASYSNYFASIDSLTEQGVSDTNGDGFLESLTINGNNRDWWAQIDTTKLSDGPVIVNYVVWDTAGNPTHYAQTEFISNNAPVMTSIDIGTDLNGNGSIDAGEITNFPANSNFAATGFKVRNNLLYFKANYTKGTNTPLYFSVKYGGVEQNGSLTNGTAAITNFASIPDSATANDRTFTLSVYDSTTGTTPGTNSQGFVQTLSLTIKNQDTVKPVVDLAPFGQRWSAPLDSANGNVNTDTGKTLGLAAYTDNVPGSLGSLQGHVEYAADSRYNPLPVTLSAPGTGSFTNTGNNNLVTNSLVYFAWTAAPSSAPNGTGPYYVINASPTSFQVSTTKGGTAAVFGTGAAGIMLASPDLSGKVIFRGKLGDDQRVSTVTVTIPGYNSGNPVTLANWSSAANNGNGGLAAQTSSDWVFALDSGTESVSQADGHAANWNFTFDTSKITGVAASNVPVTFTVTDGGGNTATTSTNVDIVPYITDFSRKTPFVNRLSDNTMNPGAGGYYPVYQGGTGYTLTGFNLSTNVRVGSTNLNSPVLTGTTSLSVGIPSALTVTVGNSTANLTVTTNGIDSINNTTAFATGSATNANGVAYSSIFIEDGSFTNARQIYVDDQAPSISVAPFGQKYPVQASDDPSNGTKSLTSAVYADNVAYSGITTTRSDGATTANWLGHVEYAADNVITVGRPAVSGVVTVKGKAFDNERIAKITATIPGFDGGNGVGVEFEIYNLTNGFEYYNGGFAGTGTNYSASGSTSTLLGTKGWTAWADGTDYKLADSSRVALGHVTNWNFSWDTSKIATVAAKNVTMTFKVYDADSTPNTQSAALTIDVAPYVTSVATGLDVLSPSNTSVYDRTALGHYPVNANETITLNGFNLTGAAGVTGITSPGGVVSVPMAAASTGNLPITVNSVPLVNNLDNNSQPYNQVPNGINNSLLTNDVAIDVWQFNTQAAVPISGQVASPVMKISPTTGKIGLAFANGPLYFSMGGNTGTDYSYEYWIASYDFMTSVAFAYDSAGHTYGTAAGGDINSASADKFVFMTDRWGMSDHNQGGTYNGTKTNRMESIGLNNGTNYDFDKYRIKSPSLVTSRIATGSNSTNIYLAYYDNMKDEIAFRYGNLADTQTTKANFGNFVDSDTAGPPPLYNNTYKSIVAGNTTGRSPGEYVSIAVIPGTTVSTDKVVMVWYDATNQRLLYSYNVTPTSGTTGPISGNTVWSSPTQIFSHGGQYCQVAVDASGGIHIAAYDTLNANLVYAHMDDYTGTNLQTCTVDSYGIVGTNISLDVASVGGKFVPYIGYYAPGSIRPKYAYLVDTSSAAPDGAVNDSYTGKWEITLLPTTSNVPQDQVSVGVWKTAAGALTTSTTGTSTPTNTYNGYNSTNYGQLYGNGTNNGVLAYETRTGPNGRVETAQKK